MNRLKTLNQKFIDTYVQHPTVTLTWMIVLILLAAYAPAPHPTKLWAICSYLAAGVVGVILERSESNRRNDLLVCLLPGLATAFSLLLLANEGLWVWWLALTGVAILLTAPPENPSEVRSQAAQIHILLIFLAVLTGLWLGGVSTDQSEVLEFVVLGLGLLVINQGAILIYHSYLAQEDWQVLPPPTESGQESAQTTRRISRMTPKEVMELSTRIHVTADGLVRAVQAINDVISQQSSGASEQVDVIRLTNTLMDNFLHLSERISEQAHTLTQSAEQTTEISDDGQTAITQAIQGMDQIRNQVSNIGMTIVTLAQLTRRIDEIITSVTEIATQSNLLALNASIEAARAGVHGRGFAVVADEVRSLSQQSTNAANQVRGILAEIQSAVRQTINATEIGMQGVDAGVSMTQQANRIMIQLSKNVVDSNDAVKAIYDVIRQQASGLEEISGSMDRIDRITQQNLTSTRMVSTVSTNLTRLADDLQDVVQLGQDFDDNLPDPPALNPDEMLQGPHPSGA
jgi:methyl-accepting chemotaxis protein